MADDERLVVLLEARVKDLEKNMAKASGTTAREFGKMRKSSSSATRAMEADMIRSTSRINQALATTSTKIGAWGKAAVAGLVAGGIAGVVSQVQDIAKGIAEIGDQAKIAGVDVEAFQELKYVAEQNRIGVDSLTDGLKELNLRADEFILTGKGSAEEAFKRLGYTAEELKTKLKEPSELFAEIIGRLKEFDRAAAIRIADEIFGGTGGEKFVQLIDRGRDGIRATIKEARELGIVVDEGMVKKADEIDRKFNALATAVGVTLKGAIVSAADSLAEFIDGFRDFQNQANQTLQNSQSRLMAQKAEIGEQMRRLQSEGLDEYGESYVKEAMKPLEAQLEALNAQEDKIIAELQNRSPFNPMKRTADREWTPPDYTPPPSGGTTRDKAAEEAEKEAKAVRDLIDNLQVEHQQVGMNELEIAKMNALRQAGAAATQEQRNQIAAIIEATYREREALEATRQMLADLKSDTGSFITAFRQGMVNGEGATQSFKNAFLRMADSIASRIEQMFADKLITALFGGMLGGSTSLFPATPFNPAGKVGLFAKGTNFAPGGPAIVGERGPELVNLPRGSQVIPNHRMAAVGGGTQSVKVEIDMKANGQWTAHVRQAAKDEAETVGQRTKAEVAAGVKGTFEAYRKGQAKSDARDAVRNYRRIG